jgi:two-component system sensor histidine kinase KdpD
MHARLPSLLGSRPSAAAGVLATLAGVAAATLAIYPLRPVAPVESLAVVYVPVVVVVSMFWSLRFGIASAALSAAAFGFFHLPPTGRLALSDGRDWTGLAAFVIVAVTVGLIAELARNSAREAEQRRREADLAADLAQLLLGAMRLDDALPLAAQRIAGALAVGSAAIELGEPAADDGGRLALALVAGGRRTGTLVLPDCVAEADIAWARSRLLPALESILAAALHRDELSAEVVETAALRRSDEMKTALLRSVSHDLRTPVTAILSAAATLDPEAPARENVAEVRDLVGDAATRLWRLIEKLLDLSLLQAGETHPREEPYSLEEVLQEAVAHSGHRDVFRMQVDPDLPLLRGDPAQLERAFANVLENSARYSAGKPVSVRARAVGGRARVLIVDEGPGLDAREHERVFLPFYRAPGGGRGHHGSGLGLAIAKGFIEVGGGRIDVESVPAHGTTFVIELPIPAQPSGDADGTPPATSAAAPATGAPR